MCLFVHEHICAYISTCSHTAHVCDKSLSRDNSAFLKVLKRCSERWPLLHSDEARLLPWKKIVCYLWNQCICWMRLELSDHTPVKSKLARVGSHFHINISDNHTEFARVYSTIVNSRLMSWRRGLEYSLQRGSRSINMRPDAVKHNSKALAIYGHRKQSMQLSI